MDTTKAKYRSRCKGGCIAKHDVRSVVHHHFLSGLIPARWISKQGQHSVKGARWHHSICYLFLPLSFSLSLSLYLSISLPLFLSFYLRLSDCMDLCCVMFTIPLQMIRKILIAKSKDLLCLKTEDSPVLGGTAARESRIYQQS